MGRNIGVLARQAEVAVRGIKDKELRKEAFRILFLQMMAGGNVPSLAKTGPAYEAGVIRRGPGRPPLDWSARKAVKRPGRRGGGVVTTALNRLLVSGYFKANRDAATVFRSLAKKRLPIEPSQLRMELLRFARSGKLKRRIKMKGQKVTYLYRR